MFKLAMITTYLIQFDDSPEIFGDEDADDLSQGASAKLGCYSAVSEWSFDI